MRQASLRVCALEVAYLLQLIHLPSAVATMGNLDNYRLTFGFPVGEYMDKGRRFRDWTLYDVFSEGLYTHPAVCIALTTEPRHA
jgi:hypothetical protein